MAQELNLVDMNLVEVPEEYAVRAGPVVTSLNLSENAIRPPGNLARFTRLQTLILDKNGLPGLAGFPKMTSITTFWFNNNDMTDLVEFMDEVVATFPNVTYLSAMRNPAAPPLVCVSEEDVASSSRYRLYVIHRLPKLQFLDASPVTPDERKEAAARGQFLAVRKPKQKSTSGLGKPVSPAATGVFGAFASTSTGSSSTSGAGGGGGGGATPGASDGGDTTTTATRKPQAFLGLGTSAYDGRHSEGNRFIVDRDL